MISTGTRWTVESTFDGEAGASFCLLFHAQAETSGAERKAAKTRGLMGLEGALMVRR